MKAIIAKDIYVGQKPIELIDSILLHAKQCVSDYNNEDYKNTLKVLVNYCLITVIEILLIYSF